MGQAIPQEPQLAMSVCVSTQVPPQAVWPMGHMVVARQVPIWQLWPIGQTLPQVPQLLLSAWVSTQAPAHAV
jgi:hypothetical protein